MSKNMREKPRIDINRLVAYSYKTEEKDETDGQGFLINISTTGLLIETKEALPESVMHFCNANGPAPISVTGEVVHTKTKEKNAKGSYGPFRSGIRFTDTPEKAKNFVISIIKPKEAEYTTVRKNTPSESGDSIPDFDSDSIQSLLEDDDNSPDDDALEGLGNVLNPEPAKKTEMPPAAGAAAPTEDSVKNRYAATEEKAKAEAEFFAVPERKSAFSHLNLACFIIIMLTVSSFFILSGEISPFTFKTEIPNLRDTFKMPGRRLPTIPKIPDITGILPDTILGRYVEGSDSRKEYIIKGCIFMPKNMDPGDIPLSGRIFSKKGKLLGQRVTTAENAAADIQEKAASAGKIKFLPFSITFTAPTNKITRFDIDIY